MFHAAHLQIDGVENVPEYPILLYGLVIGILPVHFLSKKMDSPFAPRLRYKACQPLFPWCDGHLFPTPAVRPGGRALFFLGGPCLSGASWTALLYPAAVLSDEVGLGVNGFGSFSRKKRTSPAGAKPGNIK